MPALGDYVKHATTYGGLRDCLEAAWDELDPVELGELAMQLRELGQRRRRVGRNGRTVYVERFSLTREEAATLIDRLVAAGVGEPDVCRYAGASPQKVRQIVQTLTFRTENGQAQQGRNGNQIHDAMDRSSAKSKPSDRLIRRCPSCGSPLPSSLRAHARYCPGGRCKMAAHRARQAA